MHETEYEARYTSEYETQNDSVYEPGHDTGYALAQAHQPNVAAEPHSAEYETRPAQYEAHPAEYETRFAQYGSAEYGEPEERPAAQDPEHSRKAPPTAVYGIRIPSSAAQTTPSQYDAPTHHAPPGRFTEPNEAPLPQPQPWSQPEPHPHAQPQRQAPPQPRPQPQPELHPHAAPSHLQPPATPAALPLPQPPVAPFPLSPQPRAVPRHQVPPQLCASPQPCGSEPSPQQTEPPQHYLPMSHPATSHQQQAPPQLRPPPQQGFTLTAPSEADSQSPFGFDFNPPPSRRFPACELYPADLRPMLTRHRLRRTRHRTAASVLTGAALALGVSALRPWTALTSSSGTSARGPTMPSAEARIPAIPTSIGLSNTRPES